MRELVQLGVTESSEGLVSALTDHAPVSVFVANTAGEAVYANDRLCDLTGLTVEQLLGFGLAAALHSDDAEPVTREWATSASGAGQDFSLECQFLRPDGSVVWVEGSASAVRDRRGRLLGWVGVSM
jgi:two-component system NtrC family sensor kinase